MAPTPAQHADRAQALWGEIVRTTREACLLRQEGHETDAVKLLQGTLPNLIRTWSAASGYAPEKCRETLRALFAAEQEHMRAAMIQRKQIVEEVCARLGAKNSSRQVGSPAGYPSVESTPPIQLRRRVPFGDVVEMIDALQDAERESIHEAVLPARVAQQSLSSVGHRTLTSATAVD